MKPIGTVTKYYPFINSDARTKIEKVLELSNNFSEFVYRLLNTEPKDWEVVKTDREKALEMIKTACFENNEELADLMVEFKNS